MSLFLHLKYTNHKTKPLRTLAVIGVGVPALLKTNDLLSKGNRLQGLHGGKSVLRLNSCKNGGASSSVNPALTSFDFISVLQRQCFVSLVLQNLERHAKVLVLLQATTVHMVYGLAE